MFAPFDEFRDLPAPTYLIDGFIEDGGLAMMIGASGTGKSAVMLDMLCSVVTGKPWKGHRTRRARAVYIAGEGVHGAAQRIKAWEDQHGVGVGQDLFIVPEAVLLQYGKPETTRLVWDWLASEIRAAGVEIVVLDTLARMAVGLDENSATDMGLAVRRLDKLRADTGACVVIVHHTKRGGDTARGSSALIGAADSEITVRRPEDADDPDPLDDVLPLEVVSTKQKNGVSGTVVPVTIRPGRSGSIVVTDPSGGTGDDVFASMVMQPKRVRSSVDQWTARIHAELASWSEGLTTSDLVSVLGDSVDRDTAPPTKVEVMRAVEKGVRIEIMVRDGARVRTGPVSIEDARTLGKLAP